VWRAFDLEKIKTFVAEGRVVFVDVTADWCLTCQVNKTLVLDRAPVATWFANENVVAMKADWTRPSDEIAAYLASFRRYGIPLSVVYGPHAPGGIPLPEILTPAVVLNALSNAAGQETGPQRTK
jgi:suppressor for copper-sensitivity B